MGALLVLLAFVLVAVAAPFLGADSSDARSERARPAEGWFPAEDRDVSSPRASV
jgi:hypothetical protein